VIRSTESIPAGQVADTADDAKRGRMAAHMLWRLEPDEALIVEMDHHDGFWIFGMGGAFMGSLDFLYRPVSYTPARTVVDDDGVVRFVIAHHYRGVHNWLDTQALRGQSDLSKPVEPERLPHSAPGWYGTRRPR
jgi:hypothetical protein